MRGYTTTKPERGLDYELIAPSVALFTWYGDTVTEIQCLDDDGRAVRLAVWNKNRRVVRSAYVETGEAANLARVGGLVRRSYGSAAYGHTDYYLGARDE